MSISSILVGGIGNIFFGDDAFGVEVVRRLMRRPQPAGVQVVDFGIRALDLTFSLLDPFDAVILVDAVPRGGPPGTLYVLEPQIDLANHSGEPEATVDPHSLDPVKVLRMARSMGATVDRIFLVGCEPTPFDPDVDLHMEISKPVLAAIEEAVRLVQSLVRRLQSNLPLHDELPAPSVDQPGQQ